MRGWRFLAALGALLAYAVLSHWLMIHAPAQAWTVAALFGPLLTLLTLDGLRRHHPPTLFICGLAAVGLGIATSKGSVDDIGRLYVLQHAAIHLALAWTFGITLRQGAKPLITMMAEHVHTRFTPEMRAYTRRLTAVWAAYFIMMILISLLLYALAPWSWWSMFCNLVTPLAAASLFVGDHLWRLWRHPDFERVSLSRAVQAFRARGTANPR